jgi:tetratricopeptide (TPR) repeat protein
VLQKEKPEEAENLLREYARTAPKRSGFPSPAAAHAWLGRQYESGNDLATAREEFENALRLDPRNKIAQEELKKLKKN